MFWFICHQWSLIVMLRSLMVFTAWLCILLWVLQTCSSCDSLTEHTMWPCREYLFIWSTQQVCLSENCPSVNMLPYGEERNHVTPSSQSQHPEPWPSCPNRVKLYPPKKLCFLEPWGKNCPLFSWVSKTKKNKSISVPCSHLYNEGGQLRKNKSSTEF